MNSQISAIQKYFNGEKAESLIFMALGFIALFFALYFYFFIKHGFWKGVAIPFAIVAFLEIIVGTTIILRSPKDIVRVENFMSSEPSRIENEEIPRMEIVLNNFVIFRYIEIILIITGILLMYSLTKYNFWKGFGLGLFIQGSIVLTLDFFAEKRGHIYIQYLQKIEIPK